MAMSAAGVKACAAHFHFSSFRTMASVRFAK